ncbi:uncharacterized protein DEA37_0013559, partial [Paragonimus westermani]
MEMAFASGNTGELFRLIRATGPRRPSISEAISETDGTLVYNKPRWLERWVEHIEGQFNWPPASTALPPQTCNVVPWSVDLELPPTETEVRNCIAAVKYNEAAGPDDLVPALFKEGVEALLETLTHLFQLVWTMETISRVEMSSAVDRTADFIQFVQLASRATSRLPSGETVPNRTSANLLANGTQISTSLFAPTLQPDHEDVPSLAVTLHTNRPTRSETRRNDRQALVQRSEFMQMAASIGRDLANTFGKLEKLNNLARRQSLFDDHSTEVQHLTYIVKEDMADLNHRIATLQSMSKSQ